jgi:hypothetical protein
LAKEEFEGLDAIAWLVSPELSIDPRRDCSDLFGVVEEVVDLRGHYRCLLMASVPAVNARCKLRDALARGVRKHDP